MKEKILELLLKKFVGVRKDGLEQLARSLALQVQDEAGINEVVDKLTAEQVSDFVKDYRADVDREVSQARTKLEEKFKAKGDPKGDPEPDKEPKGNPDEEPQWAKDLRERNEALSKELQDIKQGNVAKTRSEKLNELFGDCKDEVFKARAMKDFARMSFDSDEAFEEYLSDTAEDIKRVNQDYTERSLANSFSKPFTGNPKAGKEASESEINEVVGKMSI